MEAVESTLLPTAQPESLIPTLDELIRIAPEVVIIMGIVGFTAWGTLWIVRTTMKLDRDKDDDD